MLDLAIWRYRTNGVATLGFLMAQRDGATGPTWEQLCYVCEDGARAIKVDGETRIPAGFYNLALRRVGGMHAKYAARFPEIHDGMIWLQNVPEFKWVYMHIGNSHADTAGCPLVGEKRDELSCTVSQSRTAYFRIYPEIAEAIRGDGARLAVLDLDSPQLPLGR